MRRRLGVRVTAVLAAVTVVMSGVDQSAWASASAQPTPPTPQQRSGTAAGAPHSAPPATAATKAGAVPVTPAGAAPQASTHTAPLNPHVSNVEQTGTATAAPPRQRPTPPTPGQEITGKRSATMSVFANPDGTETAKVYSRPVHYRTADGSWADIDTTLGQGGSGRWVEKADAASTSFAASAADPALASVPAGPGQSIAFGLQGAANVPGTANGSTIAYPGVAAHTDVSYFATVNGGVKETLQLSAPDAPTTFVFPLTLTGLTPSVTGEGSVVFTNAAGQVVDTIAHGFMRDSNIDPRSDEGVFSSGVSYTLIQVDGKPALQVNLDAAWLHDPARVFPVQVDPSIANLNTSGSTYVMSPFNNDYSGGTELDVGTYDGGSNVANSYLKFDTGSLTNDYIEAATLNLDEIWSYSCQARTVWASPITSGWGVGGLKTYPWVSIGGAVGWSNVAAGHDSGCPGPAWESIDLGDNPSAAGTQLIESWTHGGPNNGLAVTADTHDSYGWKKFDSFNSPYPPYLSITYSPFGAAYSFPSNYVEPTATSSGSQQVTLTNLGNGTWIPGNQHLWYQLYDMNWNNLRISGSVDPWTELPTQVAPNQTITMTGNIGPVNPGQYYLCWDMFDGNTSSNLSYGVPSPCEVVNSANVPPQIDSENPPSNAVLSTLQPQLFATGHDPDNYPGHGITFDFQVYSVPAGGGSPTLVVDSGAQASGNYVVPAGKLAWNQTYYWTVSDNDTIGSSPWSSPAYFTTAVPQPLITAHVGANTGRQNFDPGVGDYTNTATDASVAAAGPALAITRSYNSLDPRTGGLFGAGWSTVYDTAATPDADGSGNVVVTYPDGHTVRFGLNGDGTTYTPPQGTYATFAAVTGGGYSLTARGGSTYTFAQQAGSTWKLTSITDAAGRAQTLAYDGSGNLATVTNTGGNRALHFTWSGGHVATVTTDPVTTGGAALTWTYTYSGNTLTKVCPPTSSTACTGYSYTSGSTPGSHYRSTVLDAQPYAYWRLNQGSTTSTAVDEVAANLGVDNGAFTNVSVSNSTPHPGSPSESTWFNGVNASLQLPNNLVESSSYLAVQLWFQTEPNGTAGVLMSTGHSAIGASNPSTGAMPVLYVGTDGKLYGQFWNGSVAPIVSATKVNDSAWHQVTLVGQGNTQSMYLDGALAGSQSGNLANLDPMNFIGAGYVNGNPWVNGPAVGWSYFTGNIADAAFYNHALGTPAVAQQYAAGHQATAEMTGITTPAGNTHAQVTYDNILDRATGVTDQYGGAWALAPPTTAGSSAQYRGAVYASNPTDFWPLTDTTGTQAVNAVPTSAISATSDGYGTYSGVTLGQAGPLANTGDTAATFNGTSSTLTIPVQSTAWVPGGKAIGLWFKSTTPGGVLTGWGNQALLYIGTDSKLYAWYGSGYLASPQTVTDGKWHYVAVSQTANWAQNSISETEFLDGASVSTATAPIINSPALATATIGSGTFGSGAPASAASTNPGGYFTGSVADVAFYNTPLNGTTVTTLYTAAQKSSTSPTPITTATVIDPGSHTLSSTYDPANGARLVASTDGLGNTTHYTFDSNGFGYTTTYPDGNYVTTTHDTRGNALSRTTGDSSGASQTSYATYPTAGTYAVTDPRNDEPVTTLTADSAGPSDTTYRTSYTYNTAGALLTLTDPDGAVTTNTYTTGSEPAVGGGTEPAGLLATQKDPLTHTTTYSFTAAGDQAGTVAPSGLSTTNTFDQLGRKLSATQTSDTFPSGITASFTWDGQNRLLSQTGPATTDAVTGTTHTPQTTYTYDADGDVLTQAIADTTGGDTTRTTTNTFNSHDELATTTDPAQRQTSYGYDSYGNRTGTTDPAGDTYTDSYDADRHHTATTLTNWTGDPNNPISATSLVLDSRAYDPNGFLASDTDAMGRTTSYSYDDTGRPLTSTLTNYHTPGGAQTPVTLSRTTYDAAGNATSRFDLATAGTTSYVFDPAGHVTTKTDPNNHATSYTYDADGQTLTRTVANGSVNEETDFGYDTIGDITSQAVHNGSATLTTTATYDQRGALTSTVDPRGNVTGGTPASYTTSYSNDAAGRRTMVTGATVNAETNGGTPSAVHPITEYGFNTFGDKTSASDPDGNITSYTYDADSELLGVSQPVYTPPGGTAITPLTTYTYTPLGYPASTTDPLNHTTSYTSDQLGHRVTTTQPAVGGTTPVSHYTYDTDGEQLSATDPTGAQTQATYDELGQPVTTTQVVRQPTSTANTTTYAYDPTQNSGTDPHGKPLSVTLPGGQKTQFGYDGLGELTSTTDANTHTTSLAYDADGHLTKTTLPDGTATTVSYDPAGRQTGAAQLDATGATLRTTATGYDPAGNITSSTDANNVTITDSVDAGNHRTQQVQPISGSASITTGYGYDAAGHTTRYTSGNNQPTIYTYNPLRLPENTVVPAVTGYTSPANTTTTRTYNAAGELTTLTEPGGVTQTSTYDELGRLTSQAGAGAEAATTTRTIGYDLAGRLTSASAPAGTDTYTYDDRGLLLSAAGPSGTASNTYNNNGQLTARTDTTGTAAFTYTPTGKLATAADPLTATTASYSYNTLDQLTGIGYGTGNATQSDTYNSAHELTGQTLTAPGGATEAGITYGYDPNGNVTSKTTTGTTAAAPNTYQYDQAGRLTSWSIANTTTNYTYDNDGNRTQAGTTSYTYNARDQLVSATTGSSGYTVGYDARGAMNSVTAGTTTTTYGRDAFDQMTSYGATTYSYDALGRTTTAGTNTFTYNGTNTTPVADGTQTFSRGPDGQVLSVNAGGSAAAAFTDQHGDLTALFTASGSALTGSIDYDPWGNPWSTAGTQADLGYQGGWTDSANTRFVATASRWYIPSTGGFTSHDTISNITGTAAAANPYAYGNDNPVTNNDTNGHLVAPPVAPPAPVAPIADSADAGPLGFILGILFFGLSGDEAHVPSNPAPAPAPAPGPDYYYYQQSYSVETYKALHGDDYNDIQIYYPPAGPDVTSYYPSPTGSRISGRVRTRGRTGGGTVPIARPPVHIPTHDEIIAARVHQPPINPRPYGQVTGPGIVAQPGTKTPDTGPSSDQPPITNTIATPNPTDVTTPYLPITQATGYSNPLTSSTDAEGAGNNTEGIGSPSDLPRGNINIDGVLYKWDPDQQKWTPIAWDTGGAVGRSGAAGSEGPAADNPGPGKELVSYWPPNRGAWGDTWKVTLLPGTKIDRYGSEYGTFTSPVGVPFAMRSLPPETIHKPYNVYEVAKPLEVEAGLIAPWFGQLGWGIQYELPDSVHNLLSSGHLKGLGQ